jgi:predicted nucleic acid-binding protein
MSVDFFIDSNIAIYAVSTPSTKRDIARSLIAQRPYISTQVAMETLNVLIKKFRFERSVAIQSVTEIVYACETRGTSLSTLLKSFSISQKYQLSHWDSLVVASALEANCTKLFSEDLHHGLVIENRLTIVNPFL